MNRAIFIVSMMLSFSLAGCLHEGEVRIQEDEEKTEPIVEEELPIQFPQ